ncbi:MAG: hypothetical protein WCL08_07445 [Verrucomicrobiota bacterium]
MQERRYRAIVEMDAHLERNGTQIIKLFIHLSKNEQRKRFLDRIDEPYKSQKCLSLEEDISWGGRVNCTVDPAGCGTRVGGSVGVSSRIREGAETAGDGKQPSQRV